MPYLSNAMTIGLWFAVAASSLAGVVALIWRSRGDGVDERLEGLAGEEPFSTPAPASSLASAIPGRRPDRAANRRNRQQGEEGGSVSLRDRMMQAGLYGPGAVAAFQLLRLALLVGLAALGFWLSGLGHFPMSTGVLFGVVFGLAGTLLPGFWLDHVKRVRQTKIRRALPDALDVMSVCLQGGLSLSVALSHVARELTLAHPALADELNIMERQIQMGRSTGEAIREMANRFDLDELRSMASVITQAERIGASAATALELFADSMRVRRYQRAEELAHRASVKMLFPTLIFIFPAVFIVILGPAMVRIYYELILQLATH